MKTTTETRMDELVKSALLGAETFAGDLGAHAKLRMFAAYFVGTSNTELGAQVQALIDASRNEKGN